MKKVIVLTIQLFLLCNFNTQDTFSIAPYRNKTLHKHILQNQIKQNIHNFAKEIQNLSAHKQNIQNNLETTTENNTSILYNTLYGILITATIITGLTSIFGLVWAIIHTTFGWLIFGIAITICILCITGIPILVFYNRPFYQNKTNAYRIDIEKIDTHILSKKRQIQELKNRLKTLVKSKSKPKYKQHEIIENRSKNHLLLESQLEKNTKEEYIKEKDIKEKSTEKRDTVKKKLTKELAELKKLSLISERGNIIHTPKQNGIYITYIDYKNSLKQYLEQYGLKEKKEHQNKEGFEYRKGLLYIEYKPGNYPIILTKLENVFKKYILFRKQKLNQYQNMIFDLKNLSNKHKIKEHIINESYNQKKNKKYWLKKIKTKKILGKKPKLYPWGRNIFGYRPKNENRQNFTQYPDMDEIIPNLYIGNYKKAREIVLNNKENFACIIKLSTTRYKVISKNKNLNIIDKFKMPYPPNDQDAQNLGKNLPEIIKIINHYLNKNQKVLVHSNTGALRSAAVILAYLMHEYKLSYEQAYNFLITKRYVVGKIFTDKIEVRKRLNKKSTQTFIPNKLKQYLENDLNKYA